jgi:hypothetical protein
MPFTDCTVVVNNISSLSDLPNTTDGLTSTQLKQKFDQTGTDLKTYLNDTLLNELESTTSGSSASERIGGRSIAAKSVISGLSAGSLYSQINGLHSQLNGFVSGTGFMPTTGGTFTGEVYFPSGTASLPSISFSSDNTTGIYKSGTEEISLALGSLRGLTFNKTETLIRNVPPLLRLSNTFQGTWTTNDVIGKLSFYTEDTSGIGERSVASLTAENTANNTTTTADLVFKTSIFNTVETEKMRLTSSGNLGLNTTTPSEKLEVVGNIRVTGNIGVNIATAGANLHVNGDVLVSPAASKFSTRFATTSITPDYQFFATGAGSAILAGRFSADASSSRIYFAKSRNATAGSHTVVNSGDQLGVLSFGGSDGTNISEGARISVEVDGTPGTNDMPGRIVFLTTADGSATPTERVRIDSAGVVSITAATTASAANVFIVGTTSGTVTGALQRSTSSRRYKTNIIDYDKGIEKLKLLRPVYYNGINDGDTQFAGLIAEEVHDAGLSEFVQYNEENLPESLAYTHMTSLLIKTIQEQQQIIESLKTRLELLESKVV